MGFFDVEAGSTVSRRSSRHHTSSKHRDDKTRLRSIAGSDSKKSRSRSRSRTRSTFFGLDAVAERKDDDTSHRHHRRQPSHNSHSSSHHHHHHAASYSRKPANSSFFSLPNVSSRSIFSNFGKASGIGGVGHGGHHGGGGASSYYRRQPRSSFLQRAYKKLKRLLRDLVYYAKKHPVKVFMLAIMPLITGGALTALLARFGVRLPASIERMMGIGARAMSGDSVGLVGEAVRMAGVAGGGAAAAARGVTSLERNRRGDLQWERRSIEQRDYFGGGASASASANRNSSRHYYDTRSDAGSGWGGSLAGITRIFS